MPLPRLSRALLAGGLTAALASTALTSSPAATGASAATAPQSTTIAKGLVSPLSIAVTDGGAVYYSQNFAGQLWVKRPGAAPRRIYSSPSGEEGPAEVGAVSTWRGLVHFISGTDLMKRKDGRVRSIVDLAVHERRRNPDGGTRYGIRNLSDACASKWPGQAGPPSYRGIVESHPYATTRAGRSIFVADAAANAILRVRDGRVSTVAVLPPVPVRISEAMAERNGLPACVVGKTYHFEPVPTDVEWRQGMLYVTSLPGGPEDGSIRGAVHRINPRTGHRVKLAGGFVSATGVAVASDGTLFVTELFANRITRVTPAGGKRTFARTVWPSAVELKDGRLFVSTNVLSGLFTPDEPPNGKVVRYRR